MRKFEKGNPEKNKIPFGQFLIGVLVCFTMMYAGAIPGNIFQFITTGSLNTALSSIMSSSNLILQVLIVGIGAPVFEELIFRKLMCDRLSRHGKWFAILASALTFALFHGNFSQFFYALLLGVFFAYVYMKTGNIFYSMAYHAIINLSSTLISTPLTIKANTSDLYTYLLAGWAFLEIQFAIAGLILLIVFRRKIHIQEEDAEIKGKAIFSTLGKNWGFWLIYAASAVLFVYSIVTLRVQASPQIARVECDMRFTEIIEVRDDDLSPRSDEFRFSVSEDGNYAVFLDFYDNEEPSFITGVAIVSEDGQIMDSFSANLGSIELMAREYKKGDYKLVLEFLPDEESTLGFFDDYMYIYDDISRECYYEGFGVPGTYSMNYHFRMTKTK